MRPGEEGVLAHVDLHRRVQRQHHDLAGWSRERATRPGPWATLMMCGIPPAIRFMPPPVFIADIGTCGSFQSIT